MIEAHESYGKGVLDWIREERPGYNIDDHEWHHNLTLDQRLAHMKDGDAEELKLRHKPDCKIWNDEIGFGTYLDFVTQMNKRQPDEGNDIPNMSLDAVKLYTDLDLVNQGFNVIYPYYDRFYDIERAFFLTNAYYPSFIILPQDELGNFRKPLQCGRVLEWFGGVHFYKKKILNGSGDPFTLINGSIIQTMATLYDLIPAEKPEIDIAQILRLSESMIRLKKTWQRTKTKSTTQEFIDQFWPKD